MLHYSGFIVYVYIYSAQYYAKERECQELRARLERLNASSSPLSPSPNAMMNQSNDAAAVQQPYINGFGPSIAASSFNSTGSPFSYV